MCLLCFSGEIDEMNVCDNLGDHLMGNVYIKFVKESSAKPCVEALNNRWYGKNSCIWDVSE